MLRRRICRDIVIVGQQPWDTEIGSNCKDIALEMSKNHRVLYVNSPLDRATLLRHRNDEKVQTRVEVLNGKRNGLIRINDNLWNLYPDCMVESINWINIDYIFDSINRTNNKKFAAAISRALAEIKFKDYILFNDSEIFKGFYLNELLKPILSIYYSRDYMLAVNYWKKNGERLEPLLISKNDICMANSPFLTDYCKKYNPNSFYIGQGCDLEMFEEIKDTPAELIGLRRPLIGYVGALQSIRLDIELLASIATARPYWTIVLVGPEDDAFKNSVLHQFDNVIFTGLKPVAELPAYIQAFDVCINPQLVNEVTIGNYPRKIDEYLAVGKPVVATKTRAMDIFKDHVHLAANAGEYVQHIQTALDEDDDANSLKRREFAKMHTWENCVLEIYKILDSVHSTHLEYNYDFD
ncbi:glycosyltransferase [Daejeonella sp.]|uniref:glycosyltransferase n=1 Tax=Daejeonella sp. TaxID=2805397 RepID=UPI003983D9C0